MAIAAFALAACVSPGEPGYLGDAGTGYKVAQDLCASCHAIDAIGVGANPEAPPLRCVLDWYDPDMLAADLDRAVGVGHPRMPTFYFGEHHAVDIVAYLKSIQTSENVHDNYAGPGSQQERLHDECADYARRSGRASRVE